MKKIDVVAAVLLVIGGLNWGLVGLLDFDLVSKLFGEMSILSRVVYCLVGIAALYQVAGLKTIQKRWNVQPALARH